MDDEVDFAPLICEGFDHSGDSVFVCEVDAEALVAIDGGGKRDDAFSDLLDLVCEGEFSALCAKRAGDGPGEGSVVGDTCDESAPSLHEGATGEAGEAGGAGGVFFAIGHFMVTGSVSGFFVMYGWVHLTIWVAHLPSGGAECYEYDGYAGSGGNGGGV